MKTSLLLCVLTIAAHCANAIEAAALDALKLLPKDQAKNIAQIEAREGSPNPERWHFLVHDKTAESGLREYVVAGGAVVAAREISQFAQSMAAENVIGGGAIKINSDQAAKLLQQYATANDITIHTIDYGLKKEGSDPLWRLTALNDLGKVLGGLVLTANNGTIISREGFPNDPVPETKEPLKTPPTPAEVDRSARKHPPSSHNEADSHKNPLKRVGSSLQKFFTGRSNP